MGSNHIIIYMLVFIVCCWFFCKHACLVRFRTYCEAHMRPHLMPLQDYNLKTRSILLFARILLYYLHQVSEFLGAKSTSHGHHRYTQGHIACLFACSIMSTQLTGQDLHYFLHDLNQIQGILLYIFPSSAFWLVRSCWYASMAWNCSY